MSNESWYTRAMDFQAGKSVYMVGIGGIGMSELAQLLKARGLTVLGSDREPSPTTKLLNDKGIDVYIGHDVQNMPDTFDTLIYSDAVAPDNNERVKARERGIHELSYFEALGAISRSHYTIAVAGSHGKTTTTAMLGKMLIDAKVEPTVVVGSIMKDFGSNFVLGAPDGPFVVEACEYRDHLLELSPTILVVTNLEWDHTDYFTSFDQLKETFKRAIERLPEDGALVINVESPIGRELATYARCRVVDYADIDVPELTLIGEFNVMNAAAAKTAALAYREALSPALLDQSLRAFGGTWRRFEYKGTTAKGALVYDDYAHHPTEVAATLTAVREKYQDKKIIVAFHPHLYSRTRDLVEEFATSFTPVDGVILAPIYAAREAPIEGVTSKVLAEKISVHGTPAQAVGSLDEVYEAFKHYDTPNTVFITMGAGDIYKISEKLVG